MLAQRIKPFIDRRDEIAAALADASIGSNVSKMRDLLKEQSTIAAIAEAGENYLKTIAAIEENKALLGDLDLGDLAKEEQRSLEAKKAELEAEIKRLLIPKDPNDERDVYLEIRAGTGGDEAGLFAADLFKLYCRYADLRGWKTEIVSLSENDRGGFKEAIALIKGKGVYSRLKFEGGTHRVQRVPETEAQGRVHTSAVTVAILPEVGDVEIEINPADLRVDVFRSGGHGGQSVNTTDSAVRITHIPSQISVSMQDEKSQHKNKDKAMKILKARLYEAELEKQTAVESADRKKQVGSGDRSERIRTYNFPQNRLSDHRVNLTIYRLEELMISGDLDEVIDALIAKSQADAIGAA
ncbi:MAG: peptide chain release factor 1 [Helicobacteraceae bacterium]|nr:peptide chain release factor 1 [Helicobacteraceae bacterium]